MKLITVDVPFSDKLEIPAQKLDPGEFITVRIVELAKLRAEFKGLPPYQSSERRRLPVIPIRVREEGRRIPAPSGPVLNCLQGFVIDARLDHLASGFELAEKLRR